MKGVGRKVCFCEKRKVRRENLTFHFSRFTINIALSFFHSWHRKKPPIDMGGSNDCLPYEKV